MLGTLLLRGDLVFDGRGGYLAGGVNWGCGLFLYSDKEPD